MNEELLFGSIETIRSIGPKRAETLRNIQINTIKDLLYYLPSRYLDRTTILNTIKTFQVVYNGFNGEVTIIGKVYKSEKMNLGRKQIFKVYFRDNSGLFEGVWFHGIKYFHNSFQEDEVFAVSGKPIISKKGMLQFVHPDFDKFSHEESLSFLNTGKIIPFYRIPKELREVHIGDFNLRKIMSHVVSGYCQYLPETLPSVILQKYAFLSLPEAIKNYHFPESQELLKKARMRMKYEEIFYLELMLALKKKSYKNIKKGKSQTINTKLIQNLLKMLPYRLTVAQKKALAEIKEDMGSPKPMNRLLQGDVGSGKTIVALIAMLIAVDNGLQAILMAPTEILADQHAKNISAIMQKLYEHFPEREIKVNLLLGGAKKSVKEKNLLEISSQESDIIIGTHALLEDVVNFYKPGIVVIDEQHRFGVEQRARLLGKSDTPDVLIMSATPIPRTLSLTLYGDLDVSIIDELPSGRKRIKTVLRSESSLPDIFNFVVNKSKEGYQTIIIYPLVEESEKLELKAAESYYKILKESYLRDLRIGLLHGRMSWREKEEIMYLFKEKSYDVLVATTVIEVGIDIPDANIMIINDAYRFGLAQLHQLRGRVGRGSNQAYCILVTKEELLKDSYKNLDIDFLSPVMLDKYKAQVRLQSMVQSNDGFRIAEIDFKLRGPGNIFSTAQSGFPEFRFIDITEDYKLIAEAKEDAFEIIDDDPTLDKKENMMLKKNLNTSDHFKFMLGEIA